MPPNREPRPPCGPARSRCRSANPPRRARSGRLRGRWPPTSRELGPAPGGLGTATPFPRSRARSLAGRPGLVPQFHWGPTSQVLQLASRCGECRPWPPGRFPPAACALQEWKTRQGNRTGCSEDCQPALPRRQIPWQKRVDLAARGPPRNLREAAAGPHLVRPLRTSPDAEGGTTMPIRDLAEETSGHRMALGDQRADPGELHRLRSTTR